MKTKALLLSLALPLILFPPLFYAGGTQKVDFFSWMALNIVVLIIAVFFIDPTFTARLRADFSTAIKNKVVLGIFSAVILYIVFFLGNLISPLLFNTAVRDIESIYHLKIGSSSVHIFLLLVLVIGPGEELFWRGFLQENLEKTLGGYNALLLTTALYTGVHIFSENFMLVLAAFVCGSFWGIIWRKKRSFIVNVASHTLWDVLVFIVLPFS